MFVFLGGNWRKGVNLEVKVLAMRSDVLWNFRYRALTTGECRGHGELGRGLGGKAQPTGGPLPLAPPQLPAFNISPSIPAEQNPFRAPVINFSFPIMKKFGEWGHRALLPTHHDSLPAPELRLSAGPAVANEERWQQQEEGPSVQRGYSTWLLVAPWKMALCSTRKICWSESHFAPAVWVS